MKPLIKISAKEAEKLTKELGMGWASDGFKTYYATNEARTAVWEFETKEARDNACLMTCAYN